MLIIFFRFPEGIHTLQITSKKNVDNFLPFHRGHPYVTGLAIAGGIMFMGLQGAIIGPIILCFFIVVFKMYGSLLDPDQIPATPQRKFFTDSATLSLSASAWIIENFFLFTFFMDWIFI